MVLLISVIRVLVKELEGNDFIENYLDKEKVINR